MFEVKLQDSAKRFLKKLDNIERKRLIKKLYELEKNPKLGKPLIGGLKGYWSLRVGKYRCVYIIENLKLIVIVLDIGHRKNVYG